MPMNDVAKRIQAVLDARNEKLKPIAEQIGAGYYSVYPWWQREHAKADPKKVLLFAEYFGVPVGHLLYGDPIDTPPDDFSGLLERAKSLQGDDRTALERVLRALLTE